MRMKARLDGYDGKRTFVRPAKAGNTNQRRLWLRKVSTNVANTNGTAYGSRRSPGRRKMIANCQTAAVNSLRHCRARPGNPSSSKSGLAKIDGCPGHLARRRAEPVIGRAFARPVGAFARA